MIILNPGDFEIPDVIKNDIHVYIICEDKKVADEIALYEMTQEEIGEAAKANHSDDSDSNSSESEEEGIMNILNPLEQK